MKANSNTRVAKDGYNRSAVAHGSFSYGVSYLYYQIYILADRLNICPMLGSSNASKFAHTTKSLVDNQCNGVEA